jgi:glyoxylase-like metal-dependent hydrolase (beta-lactamase superfamily II)
MVQYRVLSIGTLAAHPLWDERVAVREAHATTTLIESGKHLIVVDPSLPPNILLPRMQARSPVRCDAVTDVFLTCRNPGLFRGISLFPSAQWWMHAPDRERLAQVGEEVSQRTEGERTSAAEGSAARAAAEFVRLTLEVSRRVKDAPDRLAPGVDLFPLPGITPGMAGLLIANPSSTVLVTGDAVATEEHLAQGRILTPCEDMRAAQESFREAVEIADVLVLGHDNAVLNPLRGSLGRMPAGFGSG